MEFIHNAINYVNSFPAEFWQAIGAMLGVSAILQKAKKWLSLQNEKVITFLLGFFSFVPVVIDYINSQAAVNPGVMAPRTLLVMGGATTAYRYVIKPLSNLLEDAKSERLRRDSQLVSDAEVNGVSIPTQTFDA